MAMHMEQFALHDDIVYTYACMHADLPIIKMFDTAERYS